MRRHGRGNMQNKLKIVAELGKGTEQHALLIELPKAVIDDLNIATDGTVGTAEFLEVIKQHCMDDSGSIDWMKVIYGEGAA